MEGHVDRLRAGVLEGWAWDSSNPDEPVCIEVWTAEYELLAVGIADQYREDLYQASKGNGAHGFSIRLQISNLNTDFLRIRIMGGNLDLIGSPLILNTTSRAASEAQRMTFDAHAWLAELYSLDSSYAAALIKITKDLYNRRKLIETELLKLNKDNQGTINTISAAGSVHPAEEKRDILIFPPIDWDYRYQRPQHIATGLASLGHRVFYIAPTFVANDVNPSGVIYDAPYPGVFLVKLASAYPHPQINRNDFNSEQIQNLSSSLNHIISRFSIAAPVILLQNPVWNSLNFSYNNAHVVYDCIDLISGFEATTPSMLNAEKKLMREADLVIASSPQLVNYVASHGPRLEPILVRNATSEAFFKVPANFAGDTQPTIGYLGAIERWFDADLVKKIAELRPEWNILLAGHPTPAIRRLLENVPNIKLLGEVPASQAPILLSSFDVAIIPFLKEDMTSYVNPVKVYEYLAAGRGVVSCKMPELDQFGTFVRQAEGALDFCEQITQLLAINSAIEAKSRRMRVINETWLARATQISTVITLALPASHN